MFPVDENDLEESSGNEVPFEELLFCTVDNFLLNERKGLLCNPVNITFPRAKDRYDSINWLMTVHRSLGMNVKCCFPAISIFNAFLSRSASASSYGIQLVAIVALSLAAKYNEINIPEVSDYVFMANKMCTSDIIMSMEKVMFKEIGCNVNIPNEMEYLRAISTVSKASVTVHNICKNLLLMLSVRGTNYLHSVFVSAVSMLVMNIHKESYVNHFDVPNVVIALCTLEIVETCKWMRMENYNAYKPVNSSRAHELLITINAICDVKVNVLEKIDVAQYQKSYYYVEDVSVATLSPDVIPNSAPNIGEGSFGVVKLVEYKNVSYAVKKSRVYDNEVITTTHAREVSILLSLKHDNIATIRYITEDLESIFLDLGVSDLRVWISKNDTHTESQLNLCKQLLSALVYLHSMGCLHRDIKSQNIIVYLESYGPRFVLSDFGSGRGPMALKNNQYTSEICTLWYRSPEILMGSDIYDDRLDVWSMCCTLYEFATKRVMFKGNSAIDQLYKIFKGMGTPSDVSWPEFSSLPGYDPWFPLWTARSNLIKTEPLLSSCYKSIFKVGMILDPIERATAAELYEVFELCS